MNRSDMVARRIKQAQIINVVVQPNHDGSQILWEVRGSDGTQSNGFAQSAADAMRDAATFVEAMMQPRVGGMWRDGPELRVVPAPAAPKA